MVYAFDEQRVGAILQETLTSNVRENGRRWLEERLAAWQASGALQQFNLAFSAAPRFIGRDAVEVPEAQQRQLPAPLKGYTLDRLFRVWWLLQLPTNDRQAYISTIENLFHAAEMNELVALYGALPFLAFPTEWTERTAEGIRSNIGSVLEAIMTDNPYPARYLDEPAWNQLVIKAFFTEKPVNSIYGLDDRANPELARILRDWAHERLAAGRTVNPLVWRLVGPFIDDTNLADITRIWHSEVNADREAAALACYASDYPPARELLAQRPEMLQEIEAGQLTWDTVARRTNG
ncbi:EboA domain-containing protein [Chitinophaga lutea]